MEDPDCNSSSEDGDEAELLYFPEDISPVDEFFDAIWFNNLQKVTKMLDGGFSFKSVSSFDNMALHYAVLNNKIEVLRLFKERMVEGDIDTIYISSEDDTICGTPLHTAVSEDVPVEMVRTLLEWGADINATDAKGSPVLHQLITMAWQDFETGFEREFVDSSIKEHDKANITKGHSYLQKLKLLHEFGADMNIFNNTNFLSAFHCWSQQFFWCTEHCLDSPESLTWGHEFLKQFLEYGANPDILAERNTSPLNYFAQRRYLPCHLEFIKKYREMVITILSHCKMLDSCDIHGRRALHVAAEFSNFVLLEEVLKYNNDVNKRDRFGLSPLHLITHNKTYIERELVTNIINILVQHGAYLDIKDSYGSTPVHHAIHMGNRTALNCLIKHGASLCVADDRGLSPLNLAIIEGNDEIREMVGILYDRTAVQVTKGVTDPRFGWFYPQCCHKDYTEDTKHGVIDSPEVHHKEISKWLKRFPMCNHNARGILQNSIPSLNVNKEQEQMTIDDTSDIKKSILEVLQRVADYMGKLNPLFQSTLIFGGSVSEDTKVGSPDELDVVFNLQNMSKLVIIEEVEDMDDFVLLKPKIKEEFLNSEILNLEDGYLKRSEIGLVFHKLFEKCLRKDDIWGNSRFFSNWGTINALGEGSNIGQLNVIWYGRTLKRQNISIDIVPVIKISGWQPKSLRQDIKIINSEIVKQEGCYLVMKSTTETDSFCFTIDSDYISDDPEDNSVKEIDDKLFKISYSHIEHAVMSSLPQDIKNGYKVAKSIQVQCPSLLFDMLLFGKNVLPDCITKLEVYHCVTSYVLKTALFHELHEVIQRDVSISDLQPSNWNRHVIEHRNKILPAHSELNIPEILNWTSRIYKRILRFCEKDEDMPTYFVTGSNIKTTKSIKIATQEFCKIILHFLKEFPIEACTDDL